MRASSVSRAAGASRHDRSPATMSSRIRSDSTSRVVERPAAAAGGDVGVVRLADRGEHGVVGQPAGERLEERRELVVRAGREVGEGGDGRVDRSRRGGVLGRRDVQQIARLLDDEQPVPRRERRRQLVAAPW